MSTMPDEQHGGWYFSSRTTEEKNGVLKSIIKEIVKTGEDGRTFNIVFWDPYKVE